MRALALLLVALALGCGCGTGSTGSAGESSVDLERYGLSLSIPDGYRVELIERG